MMPVEDRRTSSVEAEKKREAIKTSMVIILTMFERSRALLASKLFDEKYRYEKFPLDADCDTIHRFESMFADWNSRTSIRVPLQFSLSIQNFLCRLFHRPRSRE